MAVSPPEQDPAAALSPATNIRPAALSWCGGWIRHPFFWLCLLGVPLTLSPALDLAVAAQFYRPDSGFFLKQSPLFVFIHKIMPWLILVPAVLAVLAGSWSGWRRRPLPGRLTGLTGRVAAYLGLSLSIGPGLIINTLLKDHWGRARPSQIAEFGNVAHFSPAWLISDQCQRNCSFSSGHAALGFWLVAAALLLPPRLRPAGVGLSFGWALVVGLARIAQGGHFLSDVMASALITIGVALLLRVWLWPDRRLPLA